MQQQLRGKVAVVTGGNSGIGLATAIRFAEEGAKVAIMGRNSETVETAVAKIGRDAIGVAGDVSKLEDIGRLYQTVTAQLGNIDVLFVNAGIAQVSPIDAVDEAHFDELFGVNVRGAYFTIQRALPFLNDGASVVLNTSIANQVGIPNMSVYSATKAALRSLARTLSAELLERGIRVNAVSPGPIETPIFSRLTVPQEAQDQMASAMLEQIPLKRFGAADEVANAVLFLTSPESSFVLGHELVVDGGMSQL